MPISLDRYQILKECKGNRVNRIFIVEDKQTKQTYILKIIKIQDVEKQLREIEVHKRLNHKYIIKLIDYDVSRSYIILLVEYAKYGDLFTHLNRLGELPEKTVLKFYFQVVKAIHYLHSNGFVHRDIKPENVLITRKFSPRIADFGTSAHTGFIKNTYCGTAEYMAPEIMLRLQQTEKVDVWALGILLYEIMHNMTPFKNETPSTIQRRVREGKIRFKIGLNPAIIKLILKILKADPQDRPTTYDILTDPLFADFHGKVDEKNDEFGAERTADWDKKVDDNVQSKLNEYRKSIVGNDAKTKGPVSMIFDKQPPVQSAEVLPTIQKQKEEQGQKPYDLTSIHAQKCFPLKEHSGLLNTKNYNESDSKTDIAVNGKSSNAIIDFSEKNSLALDSNYLASYENQLSPLVSCQFKNYKSKFAEGQPAYVGANLASISSPDLLKKPTTFPTSSVLADQRFAVPSEKPFPIQKPTAGIDASGSGKKHPNECSLQQI